MDQEPSRLQRLLPWLLAFACVALGFAFGWLGPYWLVRPHIGEARPAVAAAFDRPQEGEARARVAFGPESRTVRPGQAVRLEWILVNDGRQTWTADAHRFVPLTDDLPTLGLWAPDDRLRGLAVSPRARQGWVHPGESVTVQVTVWAPDSGSAACGWQLTGPDGPVPGGRLEAVLTAGTP